MSAEAKTAMPHHWSKIRSTVAVVPSLALILLCSLVTTAFAQDPPQRRPAVQGFPDLVSGLKATPGVLGVETATTSGHKQVIFAWFENKAAALRWYYSEMHREAQNRLFPNRPPHEPLKHVPDGAGPIMAIASITWADTAQVAPSSLPISQIAIELYRPLPGGVFLGSRFAPASVPVPHMLDYTPKRP